MIINDPVYGRSRVGEPVLLEIMKSKPMQRLKGVSQSGVPEGVDPPSIPFYSRYEHSVGVLLLLRKFNANLEEQAAGLIHDVSHTVFSHTTEAVFGNPTKGDYQDKTHKKYIKSTIIPEILEVYGFDPDVVSDTKKYHLLERPMPALCADRVDYTLRDLKHVRDLGDTEFLISGLAVINGEIVFKSKRHAKLFGKAYLKCNDRHWAEPTHVARAYLLSNILKTAADEDVINGADFYKTDSHIISKIKRSNNKELKRKLSLLWRRFVLVRTERNSEYVLKTKRRYVDPKYLEDGKLHVLSHEDPEYKKLIEKESEVTGKGLRVRLRFLQGSALQKGF